MDKKIAESLNLIKDMCTDLLCELEKEKYYLDGKFMCINTKGDIMQKGKIYIINNGNFYTENDRGSLHGTEMKNIKELEKLTESEFLEVIE